MDARKMLAVAAAIVGTTAMAESISSSVVGYLNKATDADETGACLYPTFGFTFQPINDEDGWVSLSNVTVTAMDAYMGDYFYKIDPDMAIPDGSCFIYFDYANSALMWEDSGESYTEDDVNSCVGWWEGFSYDPADMIGDIQLKAGTFLMADVQGAQNITINCAGQAQKNPVPVNVTDQVYPTFANPIPRTVTLSEITVTGMGAYMGDYIYGIDAQQAIPDGTCYIYFDYANSLLMWEDSGESFTEDDVNNCVGWWEGFTYDPADMIGDTEIEAGRALMGDFSNAAAESATAVIAFPAAL